MDEPVVMSLFDKWANATSVAGFFISLVSLGIACWGFYRVKAVTKEVALRISGHLLSEEVMSLSNLIDQVLEATGDKHWPRALERSKQARRSFLTLWQNPQLKEEEQARLIADADDLRLLIIYIEKYRISGENQNVDLPDRKRRALDTMMTTLGSIQGRLQKVAMEV